MVLPMTALYVYAVARQKADHAADLIEIEGVDPQSTVYALTPPISSSHTGQAGLGAIVSAVSSAEFHPDMLKTHLADPEWLQVHVLAHQRVLTALLADYTVLPLQFCTLYNTEERVLDMITANYDRMEAALDRLAGATEWGVKIFCDRAALTSWAINSSDELQPIRETIHTTSEGASYMLRKKIALAARQLAESLEQSCTQESHRRLSSIARVAVSYPLRSESREQSVGSRSQSSATPDPRLPTPDHLMVLNAAYLVDDRKQQRFEIELARLHEEYAAIGFKYELTGPWPPYSFATIEEPHQ